MSRQVQYNLQNKKDVKNPSNFESRSHSRADDRHEGAVNLYKGEGLNVGYLESQEKEEDMFKQCFLLKNSLKEERTNIWVEQQGSEHFGKTFPELLHGF